MLCRMVCQNRKRRERKEKAALREANRKRENLRLAEIVRDVKARLGMQGQAFDA